MDDKLLNQEAFSGVNRPDLEVENQIQPAIIRALQAIQRGDLEQQLLERSLGKALLLKMAGRDVDLLEVYAGIGGGDPVIKEILKGKVSDAFKDLNVLPGIQAAREAALSERAKGAAAGKGSKLEGNALTTLPGQALNTLAELGGAEFAAKYKINRIR